MDTSVLARRLLGPIPVHEAVALDVIRAADGEAEVALGRTLGLTNVTGALHSSALITLIDAAGLAAIISAARDDTEMNGVSALGAAASLRFLRPALGPLVATGRLDDEAREPLRALLSGKVDRVAIHTSAVVTGTDAVTVCDGQFRW